jgi:hypothetical protein
MMFEVSERASTELQKLLKSEPHVKENLVIYFQGFG